MRTDVHRPSVIDPLDYDFVGCEYMKIEDLGSASFIISERARVSAHMQRTGGTYSRHTHGGNCHICGAHAIYTALFYHKTSNSYVRTGFECADKLDCGEVESFRKNVQTALEQRSGKRKAEALLAKLDLSRAWEIYSAVERGDFRRQEDTITDIVGRLVSYGSLSDPQFAFLRRLVEQVANRATIDAQRAAAHAAASPVPVSEVRMQVRGRVLSFKNPPAYLPGAPVRMLVAAEAGWKVSGTRPGSLTEARVGDTVEFCASVKRSDRDEKFGFFSRPSKAKIVAGGGS